MAGICREKDDTLLNKPPFKALSINEVECGQATVNVTERLTYL